MKLKTVLQTYEESFNNDTILSYQDFVGRLVMVKDYSNNMERWTTSVHTILSFNENSCGEGCCHSFTVSDLISGYSSSQLLLL